MKICVFLAQSTWLYLRHSISLRILSIKFVILMTVRVAFFETVASDLCQRFLQLVVTRMKAQLHFYYFQANINQDLLMEQNYGFLFRVICNISYIYFHDIRLSLSAIGFLMYYSNVKLVRSKWYCRHECLSNLFTSSDRIRICKLQLCSSIPYPLIQL